MPLGLRVGDVSWRVGSPDLLHAFFSTISVRLEPDGWGTRFPRLLNDLYQGDLAAGAVDRALDELLRARRELAALPPYAVVWDADDRSVAAPWGNAVAAPDLSHCFWTPDGRSLFDVVASARVRLRDEPHTTLSIVAA
jgi:Lon protease-like protein